MLRRLTPVLLMLVLISLVTAACVVRTRQPARRGQTIHVHDDDAHKHKKHKKQKKHKHKGD